MDQIIKNVATLLEKIESHESYPTPPYAFMADLMKIDTELKTYFETEDQTISDRREEVNKTLYEALRLASTSTDKASIKGKVNTFDVQLKEFKTKHYTGGKLRSLNRQMIKTKKTRRKRRKSFRGTK